MGTQDSEDAKSLWAALIVFLAIFLAVLWDGCGP
jgi:hypothetical protein